MYLQKLQSYTKPSVSNNAVWSQKAYLKLLKRQYEDGISKFVDSTPAEGIGQATYRSSMVWRGFNDAFNITVASNITVTQNIRMKKVLSLFPAPTMGMMTYMIRKKIACWDEFCELPVFVFTTLGIAWEKYTVGFSLTERKTVYLSTIYDDVLKWEHFPRYWPFVWGFPRSLVNSPHKGQRRGALIFSLICSWINAGVSIVRWFETPSRSSWRHCDDVSFLLFYILVMWWKYANVSIDQLRYNFILTRFCLNVGCIHRWTKAILLCIRACCLFAAKLIQKHVVDHQ